VKVNDRDRSYDVVILGSLNVNAGFRLVNNGRYPEIAEDYQRAFAAAKSLHCDLFLGAHGDYYGLDAKFARLAREGIEVWVDPDGSGRNSHISGQKEWKMAPKSLF
jgi:metallo-beta-lactamase class B